MDDTKKTLEMVRSGEFDIHTYGENHCGTTEEFKIRYHLICNCSPKLDQRGFLFDQLNIQSYFESIKRTQLSCERLTVVCLEQLLEHILAENPACQIYKMSLTLSPEPFLASMTHSWDNPGNPLSKPTKVSKSPGKMPKVKRADAGAPAKPKGRPLLHLSDIKLDGSEDPKSDSKVGSSAHYLFTEKS